MRDSEARRGNQQHVSCCILRDFSLIAGIYFEIHVYLYIGARNSTKKWKSQLQQWKHNFLISVETDPSDIYRVFLRLTL